MAFPSGSGGPNQTQQNPGGIRPCPLQSVSALDLLLLLIVWLGTQRLLSFLFLNAPEPGSQSDDAPSLIIPGLLLIALHALIMLGAIYLTIIRKYGLRLADLGITLISASWITRAVLFGVLMVPAASIVTQVLRAFSQKPFQNPQLDLFVSGGFSPGLLISSLLVTGLIVPLVEEIVFRGVFYGWLRARLPMAASIAISSLVFAFLHGIPFLFPVYALISALLALITERSGSILTAVVTHGVFNAIGIAMLYSALYSGWLPQGPE